jgi:hypothetical protein
MCWPPINHLGTQTQAPTPSPPLPPRTPAYLRNNTPVFTAKGVEVVPFIDGCQTGGAIKVCPEAGPCTRGTH